MSARRRVVVTGIGLVTPLGDDPWALQRALCAGAGGLAPFVDDEGDAVAGVDAARITDFEAADYLGRRGLRAMDRASRLTAAAAARALEGARRLQDNAASGRVGLVLGTMLSGVRTTSRFDRRAVTAGPGYAKPMDFANTVINAAAGQAAIRLGLTGLNATVSGGLASGLQAIGYAVDLIRAGRADALLAGGMDELSWECVLSFRATGWLAGNGNGGPRYPLPCDRRRNGAALGEAAVLLLLEERAAARARSAPVLGEIRGHATIFDPGFHRHRRHTGESLARAVGAALADAELGPADIAAVALSANGSPAGDRAEAEGLAAALAARARSVPVTAAKGALGESLGAGGALSAAILLTALTAGRLPGVHGLEHPEDSLPYSPRSAPRAVRGGHGLVTSRGVDGKSAALVVEAPTAGADGAGA